MTVKELLELLSECPLESEILAELPDESTCTIQALSWNDENKEPVKLWLEEVDHGV